MDLPDERHSPAPPGSDHRIGRRHDRDPASGELHVGSHRETVADEMPIALVYNGRSLAVMMATPADLTAFAVGFSITERIVADAAECLAVETVGLARGWEIRLTIPEERDRALQERARALAGRTGSGLSGVESIAEALRPVERPTSTAVFPSAAVCAAIAAFPVGRTLAAATHGTHAAAFADAEGRVVLTREDVGRHNALDKLVGALAGAEIDRGSGFVLVSSRCSYEMVHKIAAAGIPAIVSVSAPTGLAIDLAHRLGIGLAGFGRGDGFTLYAGDRRFEDRPHDPHAP